MYLYDFILHEAVMSVLSYLILYHIVEIREGEGGRCDVWSMLEEMVGQGRE